MDSLLDEDSPVDELPEDATVLVSGPPMTGKYDLMIYVLAQRTDSVVIVTTKNKASRIRRDYRSLGGSGEEDRIGVIDCLSHHDSIRTVEETASTKYTSSPENLTRIGVKFTEIFERFHGDPEVSHTGVGIHSLSQFVMHSDIKKVYQFLQVLTGQIRSTGWLGIAVIDEAVVEDAQLQTLQHHFDGIINTRENEAGQRELRVKGFSPQASAWSPF